MVRRSSEKREKEPPMTSMRRWRRRNADTDAVYSDAVTDCRIDYRPARRSQLNHSSTTPVLPTIEIHIPHFVL